MGNKDRNPRLILAAFEVNHGDLSGLTSEELGFLMRLTAAMKFIDVEEPGVGLEMFRLGLITREPSTRKVKRLWPRIAHLFTVNTDGNLQPSGDWWVPEPRSSTTITPRVAQLIERWGHRCAYCGEEKCALEVEHILPRSRGGSDDLSNLTLACNSCNCRKSNKTAAEFGHPEVESMARSFTNA